MAIPKIIIKQDFKNQSSINDPNVLIYIGWFNTLKKVKIEYKLRIKKFEAENIFN